MTRTGGSAAPARSPCIASAALHALHEVLLDLLTRRDRHDRLLPVGLAPDATAEPPRLAVHLDRVHGDDIDLERLGDRIRDVLLRRLGIDRERVAAGVRLGHRALGDDRTQEHERAFHTVTASAFVASREALAS